MTEAMQLLSAWLLTYSVHSTFLLVAALLLQRWYVRSAAGRDLLWKLAVFLPLITATTHSTLLRSAGVAPLAGRYELPRAERVIASEPSVDLRELRAESAPPTSAITPSRTATGTSTPVAARFELPDLNWLVLIALVWCAGALAALLLLARTHLRAHRRLRGRRLATDATLIAELQTVVAHTGITRRIRLTVSDAILSPIALGRREICLPECVMPQLTPVQRRVMLAHELAHLERHDPFWLIAFNGAASLWFFQPLNRIARHRFQVAAEQLCDEWALQHTREPLALAQCLAEVAHWLRGERSPLPYPGMAEASSSLVDRVERVLGGRRERLTLTRSARLAAAIAVAGFMVAAPAVNGAAYNAPADDEEPQQQSVDIANAVAQAGSGIVRFSFATHENVCGTGEQADGTRMFAVRPADGSVPGIKNDQQVLYNWKNGVLMRHVVGIDGRWTTPCNAGPARVDLRVANGRVRALELSVADPAPAVVITRDLGTVPVTDAIKYLRSIDDVSAAVLQRVEAAVVIANIPRVAKVVPPTVKHVPELQRIRDLDLSLAERQAALSRAADNGLTPNELIAAYPQVPDRAMRVELLEWLMTYRTDQVRAFLRERIQNADVLEEQQKAIAVLMVNGSDADRAFAERHLKKQPSFSGTEVVNTLAQQVARIEKGIVHFTFPARAEACGSGIDRDGAGMFALLPSDRLPRLVPDNSAAFYSFDRDDFTPLGLTPHPSWTDKCQNGPVHVLLEVADHRVVDLKVAVGNPIRAQIDTELGDVAAVDAAALLLELANRAGKTIATKATLGAVMADTPTLPKEAALVLPNQRTERPEWAEDSSLRLAAGIAADPRQPMETRRNAVEWMEDQLDEPSFMISVYDDIQDEPMKRFMIDVYKTIDLELVSAKLIQIARTEESESLRNAARIALRSHHNRVALAGR